VVVVQPHLKVARQPIVMHGSPMDGGAARRLVVGVPNIKLIIVSIRPPAASLWPIRTVPVLLLLELHRQPVNHVNQSIVMHGRQIQVPHYTTGNSLCEYVLLDVRSSCLVLLFVFSSLLGWGACSVTCSFGTQDRNVWCQV
jgi:hypothetical protein